MPTTKAIRRRQGTVIALALAAFALGATMGAPGERAAPPAAAQQTDPPLPLDVQVGQLVLLRFNGSALPGHARRALRARRAAGVILFSDNIVSPAQLRGLTRAIRRAAGEPAPLIAVDQEGGPVRRIPWIGPRSAAPQQLSDGVVEARARAAGRQLRAAGLNLALAPVADVPSVAGAALAPRAFSSDPDVAARAVGVAVQGWRAAGVGATAKHFPGLGGALVNTDDGPATIRRGRAELLARDLQPFRAAIAAGAEAIMLSHARYPALDARRIASQSARVVRLLREGLGFTGVVVTDSLEAAAVRVPVDVAAERSIRAGADLALLTGRGSHIHVYRRLLAAALADAGLRARVAESSARVLALRRALP